MTRVGVTLMGLHCPGAGLGQGWLIFAGPGPDPPGPGPTLADPDPDPSYI